VDRRSGDASRGAERAVSGVDAHAGVSDHGQAGDGDRVQEDFGKFRKELLERGIHEDTAAASATLDQAESLRRAREHCDLKVAEAACKVQVRYLCQVLRGLPKQIVFAQT